VEAAESMDAVIARATASWTFNMWLFTVLGAAGLLLAAIGLYGVLGYLVNESTRELGIRLALGATPGSLRLAVLRRGLALTAAGLVAGITLAVSIAGAVEKIVFGVRPLEKDLVKKNEFRIVFHEMDWRLNDLTGGRVE